MDIDFLPIDEFDGSLDRFSSGKPGIDNYLKNLAKCDHDERITSTTLMIDMETNEILGFFSLRTHSLIYGTGRNILDRDCLMSKSSIEIKLFALDEKYQGKSHEDQPYSEYLMSITKYCITEKILPFCGAIYVFLNSDPQYVRFYKKYTFEEMGENYRAIPGGDIDPNFCVPLMLPISEWIGS